MDPGVEVSTEGIVDPKDVPVALEFSEERRDRLVSSEVEESLVHSSLDQAQDAPNAEATDGQTGTDDLSQEITTQQQQQREQRVSNATTSQKDPPEAPRISNTSKATVVPGGTFAASSPLTTAPDDDDVTSKAAVALAAVAAAAAASNKSPAEAAAQARAVAQTFLTSGSGNEAERMRANASGATEVWRRVRYKAVQEQLTLREQAGGLPKVLAHIIQAENVWFLQQLLLLEYFQCIVEEEDQEPESASSHTRGDDPPEVKEEEEKDGENLAAMAANRLISVIKKVEGAYDSLVNLLPRTRRGSIVADQDLDSHNDRSAPNADESYETPVVVPDLLPPCTTAQGDSTLAFFRACTTIVDHPSPAIAALPSEMMTHEDTELAIKAAVAKQKREAAAAAAANSAASSAGRSAAVSSMFGGLFRRSSVSAADVMGKAANNYNKTASMSVTAASSLLNSFRRKGKGPGDDEDHMTQHSQASGESSSSAPDEVGGLRPGEYAVKIEREMLGLTVENVLERTVVRTVLAGGPAKKAGAKVGSLIVKVGNIETKNLTHFETIDELRQSQRPLMLVLKQLSEESLRSAREEMGRLIRGAGFGTTMDSNSAAQLQTPRLSHDGGMTMSSDQSAEHAVRPLIAADLRLDAYTTFLKRRLASSAAPQGANNTTSNNKKDEGVARAADKLIWILTLFVYGLEREVHNVPTDTSKSRNPHQYPNSSLYQHTLKEYADSARSAAKVLLDFTRKRIDPSSVKGSPIAANLTDQPRRRKSLPPPPPPQLAGRGAVRRKGGKSPQESNIIHEKPLLQIGDVLQRTRTFLADTTSPPAALLRGEVIALLCDILDVDAEMELSEEDSISATSGAQAGPINDLGSAGSLLKLIVLNCPIMRSPICEELASSVSGDSGSSEWAEELRRKLGNKDKYTSSELHRLHAGNRFLAVVHRLAASRSMSARIAACSLGPVIWGHLDFPHQLQLRGVITRALHDVEVMVRKATANVLHEIAELVFDARCVPWLVLMCERAMTDPEPQMRSAAMTLTWHLAEHLPNTFLGDASQGSRYLRRLPDRNDPIFADVYLLQCKLLPVATRLAEDRSPSVRLAVAAQCDRLCDALGDHWSSVVIDVLLGLLSDPDERVRCEAVMCVPRLAGIVLLSTPPGASVSEVSILEALVPASIRLQSDSIAVVRVALASAAGELLTLLVALQSRVEDSMPPMFDEGYRRYKKQVDERLIPLVQTLLNDQDPEVTSAALRAVTNASRRSSVIPTQRYRHQSADDDSASVTSIHSHASRETRQPVFLPVLSEVQVLRLLPTLSELAESKQWRVRQSAVEIVPALLGCTQQLETRTEISKLCVRLMSDRVDEVRKTAAECLCMGGSSLGSHGEDASSEWFQRIVIPAIRLCSTHQNSKQRLLSLKMVEIIFLNSACPAKWKIIEANENESFVSSPSSELVAMALSLCDDRIANVRLNVGRALESVLHLLGSDDLATILDRVGQQLANEETNGRDRDVMFFASRCTARARALKEELGSETSTVLV